MQKVSSELLEITVNVRSFRRRITVILKPSRGFEKDLLWGLLVISEVQKLQSGDSSDLHAFNFASAGSCHAHNWAIRIENFVPLKIPGLGAKFIASANASLNTAPQFWSTCRISIDMFDTRDIEPDTKASLSTDFLSQLERKFHTQNPSAPCLTRRKMRA